ncbi:MAG: hypothetical protein ABI311_13055 [Gemmatimonadaceae bacterium]
MTNDINALFRTFRTWGLRTPVVARDFCWKLVPNLTLKPVTRRHLSR